MTRGKWQAIGFVAAAAALVGAGLALPEFLGHDLREALQPIAVLPDANPDD